MTQRKPATTKDNGEPPASARPERHMPHRMTNETSLSDTPRATEEHPLKPFLPPDATLLMLGSFPPPRRRWSMEFYYPNRSNMMWEVFGDVYFGDPTALLSADRKGFDKERIVQLLRERGIALFDAARVVRRLQGNASDKYLEIVEPTDVAALLAKLPRCHHLACTGQKSAETVSLLCGCAPPPVGGNVDTQLAGRPLRLHRLPSTSRAYPLPTAQKAAYYARVFQEAGCL